MDGLGDVGAVTALGVVDIVVWRYGCGKGSVMGAAKVPSLRSNAIRS